MTNKFTVTHNRAMTPCEAEDRCKELGLDKIATDFIVSVFEEYVERADRRRAHLRNFNAEMRWPQCLTVFIGEETDDKGRLGFGMGSETFFDKFIEAMGLSPDTYDDSPEAFPEIQATFDAFFYD